MDFREHVGAPEHYLDIDRQTKKAYVEPRKIPRESSSEEKSVPEYGLDLVTREDDGFFVFGVRFVLDRATNAFPKSPFVYVVRFRLLEDNCEMEVAGETCGTHRRCMRTIPACP
jgi:hypothetical protein